MRAEQASSPQRTHDLAKDMAAAGHNFHQFIGESILIVDVFVGHDQSLAARNVKNPSARWWKFGRNRVRPYTSKGANGPERGFTSGVCRCGLSGGGNAGVTDQGHT